MASSEWPKKEHPSTYFVQDRGSEEELARIQIQDQLLTTGMGGVLPEQADSTVFQRILDVGSGSGGWLIETAKTYPHTLHLEGADVSTRMVEFARSRAAAEQVSDRVHFRTMDALRRLDFPASSFDLINLRFGMSFLRTWDWPKLLQEFQRVGSPGSVVRITEFDILMRSNSPALTRLYTIATDAFYHAGHLFTPESDGMISQLADVMQRHGLMDVQTRLHKLLYGANTPEGQHFYDDMSRGFRTGLPFFRKWSQVPDDYEDMYQQALADMQQPDFQVTWTLLTAWGTVALKTRKRPQSDR